MPRVCEPFGPGRGLWSCDNRRLVLYRLAEEIPGCLPRRKIPAWLCPCWPKFVRHLDSVTGSAVEAPEQFEAEKLLFCLLTRSFLPNPVPEPSESGAVEAPEQFKEEKLLFCLPTRSFLPNPGPEPSESAAVEVAGQFKAEKLLFCLPKMVFLQSLGPEPSEPAAVEAPERF